MVDLTSHNGTNFFVRKLGVFLGAEITEIDLRKNLSKKTQTAIADAHATHGVLVFPKQKITNNDLLRFGQYFGSLTVHPFSTSTEGKPELIVYDNKE